MMMMTRYSGQVQQREAGLRQRIHNKKYQKPQADPESIWAKDKLFTTWEFLLQILQVKLKNATNRTQLSTCWPKKSLHTLHQIQSERKTGINKVTAVRPSWAVSRENTTNIFPTGRRV